ncbi:MAG: hypothetical protein KAT29_15265 [Anaerolineales bacterium]|nr:hypothetical protein [Anaerolineales bacterium]
MFDKFLEWDELTNKKDKTPEERVLIQACAMLSTQPKYEHLTPWDMYALIVKYTKEVEIEIA